MPAVLERASPAEIHEAQETYYRPRGNMVRAWGLRDREIITDGPAGTGKSRFWLERQYAIACKYPQSRGLIVRKTRSSLTDAALVTFEAKVLPRGCSWASNQSREQRHSYKLPNRSEIVVGGLDKPEKLFSTEFDWIYVQEATELVEDDWQSLFRALRNNVVPYQQIVGDCNPGAPQHWIKQRANNGHLTLIPTRHEDNPEYWDARAATWTEKGKQYVGILDALTGVRYKRLRLGQWVSAENMIYEGWDPAIHVVDSFPVPEEWPRYRSVDFGFTNSFVCQWWAEDPDGRLYLYRELIGVQREASDWAHRICELSRGESIRATVRDHDVEKAADLEAHMGHTAVECERHPEPGSTTVRFSGTTTPAVKDVGRGIEAVANRLKRANDGEPRLFVLRGAVVERDPILEERKRPIGFAEEIESYVWDQRNSQQYGKVLIDDPRKVDDHSMDAGRYMVMYLDDGSAKLARAYAKESVR